MALGKTVRELEETMDSVELQEWIEVNASHIPLPNPWRQTGITCAANANFSGNIKKGKSVSEYDFIPLAKPKPHWREQQLKMIAYCNRRKEQF